ncbi:MAG: alanine racemase [Rickettsiales bacterium]|jgi:alanine racemase|nr:alanine racemase [Rickettsiales bacterium]
MKDLDRYDVIRVFDSASLARNVERARRAAGASSLAVTVKSDAYGFGLARAVPVLEKAGIRDYFVQDVVEAVKARKFLRSGNVYAYAGVQDGQAGEFVKHDIIPVCISLEQLRRFNSFARGLKKKPRAAIHFDTGMNRTGLSRMDAEVLVGAWEDFSGCLDIVLYLSHLHGPFEDDRISRGQLAAFRDVLAQLPRRPASIAATSGLFRLGREYRLDMVRPGGGIFYDAAAGMAPPVSVFAKILQVREVAKGATIGYSDEYRVRRASRAAVLNIGYKDGYGRDLSRTNGLFNWIRARMHTGGGFTRAYAAIGGFKCPVAGIVSMNNIIVDATGVPERVLASHRWAQVLGPDVPLSKFRNAMGYVPIELQVGLARPNPNALDLTAAEFEKIRAKVA